LYSPVYFEVGLLGSVTLKRVIWGPSTALMVTVELGR